jgi:hypothetical protein
MKYVYLTLKNFIFIFMFGSLDFKFKYYKKKLKFFVVVFTYNNSPYHQTLVSLVLSSLK